MGAFSSEEFVEIYQIKPKRSEIRFGCQLLGYHLFYLILPIEKIEAVEWNTRQALGITGHDKDFWYVVLWYDHDNPKKRIKQLGRKKPDQDVFIVDGSVKYEDASKKGYSFVKFLQHAGVDLVEGKDGYSFVRNSIK